MPRVSIIMGVYNEKKIEDIEVAVDSIISQTYKDWELLICDDGSSNKTLDMLNEIKKKDNRIKILSYSNNNGLANALNYCIKKSKGEFIARQDAQDISYPERLEKEIDFLDKNREYDLVGCNAYLYNNKYGRWGEYRNIEYPKNKDFLWTTQFLHPTVVFRKTSLLRAGMYRVAPETRRYEDYDLFMRMYSMGMKGYNIQDKLFDYYKIDGYQKKISWKTRIEEAKVRLIGFKELKLMPQGIPYIIKPLIIKVIPQKLYRILKKNEGSNARINKVF